MCIRDRRIGEEAPGIGEHPQKGAQIPDLSDGLDLVDNPLLVVTEPPGRAADDSPEAPGNGGQRRARASVQRIEDRPGQ